MASKKQAALPEMAVSSGLLPPATLPAPQPEPTKLFDDMDVSIDADGPVDGTTIDPKTGAAIIEMDDGGVTIDFSPQTGGRDPTGSRAHGANLAEYIEDGELGRIAEDLLLGIQQDDTSRSDWLETRAKGIRLLGLKMEDPKSGADASIAIEGQSTVRHPLLLEAVLRFQANARGEMLPASGPVKVSDKLREDGTADNLAEALEEDLNYYLTTTASEYYPDTDRLLFYVGFGGCGFKKVYFCPIRQRPVSESIDAKDLIVSDAATDMRNSRRVTHQIVMRPSVMKRMQIAGSYREVDLGLPNPSTLNAVDSEIANTQGIEPNTALLDSDRDFTIYECYCELNISGFEDKKKGGGQTGLALPYRVVIDKDSRKILEVRRNWREGDETKSAKICFVKYSYVPGLGFYDIGLVHILGNTTNALTAAWREMLDAGMYANFPGFIYRKGAGRQNTVDFRVPPGGGVPFDTQDKPIGDSIMPLPYKDIAPAFAQFIDGIAQTGQRIGGTAEVNIGEGKQDAPVGTTLALIEQATKVEGAVHKRLHAAQAEEFQLLKECFRENPDSFVRSSKGTMQWDEQKFLAALDDASIVPMADPNTPSHMHRLMKAQGLVQLDKAYPGTLNSKEVVSRVMSMMGVDDAEGLMAGGQPPPNPEVLKGMAELQLKKQQQQSDSQNDQAELALKGKEIAIKAQDSQAKNAMEANDMAVKQRMQLQESQDQHADRVSRERIAALGVVSDLVNHPAETGVASSAAKQFGAMPGE